MTTRSVLGVYVVAVAVLFAPALLTPFVLLPADIIDQFAPWDGEKDKLVHNPAISDVVEQFYPYLHFLRSELGKGRLPLWNPYLLNGTPFLANSVSAVFSPIQWLLMFLPLDLSFEWGAFLKLIIAGAGIYFFCRRLGLSTGPSGLAGAIYIFSGYNVYYACFPNTSISMLFGWELLVLETYLQRGNRRYLGLFGFFLGAAFLGGHVESALLQTMACLLYVAIRNWRSLFVVVGVALLGSLLASVVLLPFIQYLLESATYAQRSIGDRNPYFLSLRWSPALILPYYLGSPVQAKSLSETWNFGNFVYFLYLGVIPLFLASLTPFYRSFRSYSIALGILFFWAFAILFGLPGVFDLFTYPPILRQGNHVHILQIFQGIGSVLAGIGMSAIRDRILDKRTLVGISIVALCLLGLAIYSNFRVLAELNFADYFFFYQRFPWPLYPLWTAFSVVLFVGWVISRRPDRELLVLIVINGLLLGTFFNTAVPTDSTLDVVPERVKDLMDYPHQRSVGLGVGTLLPNYGMRWGLRDVRGYESLLLARVPAFYSSLTGGHFDPHQFFSSLDQRGLLLLRRAGCSLLLSPVRLNLTGLETVKNQFPYLYRIQGGHRVSLASQILTVSSPQEALEHVRSHPDIGTVTLEDALGASGPGSQGQIFWLEDEPDRVALRVQIKDEGWLVLRDSFAQGWVARVNGLPVPIKRADYLFRAVRVPAGDHQVTFDYEPSSFRWGLALSCFAMVALGLVMIPSRS